MHLNDAYKNTIAHRPLYSAIRKYGPAAFTIETLEQCDDEVAGEREEYYIELFGTYHYGYNATRGGDGKPTIDRDEVERLYLIHKNCRKVADEMGIDPGTVTKIIKSKGYVFDPPGTAQKKKVGMYDKNTGELIMIFDGLRQAGRYVLEHYDIDSLYNGSHIS